MGSAHVDRVDEVALRPMRGRAHAEPGRGLRSFKKAAPMEISKVVIVDGSQATSRFTAKSRIQRVNMSLVIPRSTCPSGVCAVWFAVQAFQVLLVRLADGEAQPLAVQTRPPAGRGSVARRCSTLIGWARLASSTA